MFGFKPMDKGFSVTISSNELEPTRYDSISQASTGIPYSTLLYAEKKSKSKFISNGINYDIIFH